MLTNENKSFLLLSFLDVIIRLKFNPDVISDKLERSPVFHLRILLRFTKEFYRLLNSSTGCFSILQVLVETFHKNHGSFVIYCPQGHQYRTSTSCQEGTCDTHHTLTLHDSTSSTVTAAQDHKTSSEISRLYVGHFQNEILFFEETSKSIQDLETRQFLQCACFRGQQCESNLLTTFVSSPQLLLPVVLLGV